MEFLKIVPLSDGRRYMETYDIDKQELRRYYPDYMSEVTDVTIALDDDEEAVQPPNEDGGAAGSAVSPEPTGPRSVAAEPDRRSGWCFPARFLRSEPQQGAASAARRPVQCQEVGCQTEAARFSTGPAMRTALEGRLRRSEGSVRYVAYSV